MIFKKGQRVRLSEMGLVLHLGRIIQTVNRVNWHARRGTVTSVRKRTCTTVRWDGTQASVSYDAECLLLVRKQAIEKGKARSMGLS